MRKTIQQEQLITKNNDKVTINLIEDIDEDGLALGLEAEFITIYAVEVKTELGLRDEYRVYSRKTNAEKKYRSIVSNIRNLYCY